MLSCPGLAQTSLPLGAFHSPRHRIRPFNLPFPKDPQLGPSCYPPMRSVHPLCHEACEARGQVCLITLMWSTEHPFRAGWGKDESKGRRGGGGRCSCGRLGKWEHVAAGQGAKVEDPCGQWSPSLKRPDAAWEQGAGPGEPGDASQAWKARKVCPQWWGTLACSDGSGQRERDMPIPSQRRQLHDFQSVA